MHVSAIIVHYRAPELAAAAAAAVADDCRVSGIRWEILVVDNGRSARDRALLTERLQDRLRDQPWRLLDPGENLGYAGGLRYGVDASSGDGLLLMNPDVLVRPGCISALIHALGAGADAAGPRFYWDRGARMLLPPAEERTHTAEILSRLARPSPAVARAMRRRWRRHARRHWQARETIESEALSGALLAVRRATWNELGPFDEAFRLYFEETDWLRRLTRRGGAAVYVPTAEAVHLYDRSASTEPRSSAWFRESQELFQRRWYGDGFARMLSLLDRLPERLRPEISAAPATEGAPTIDLPLPPGPEPPAWVELSPSPLGVPAAAEPLEAERVAAGPGTLRWSLPEEIWHRLPAGRYRVQASTTSGDEGPVRWLDKRPAAEADRS
jgi:GT2 family glycosyltransferase